MQSKARVIGLVAAIVAVLVVIVVVHVVRHSGGEVIHVAIVSSQTGGLAENGKDMANGALLAFEEANVAGGINGKRICVEVFDDQSDPKSAASVANLVCQKPEIVAVVGHLSSGCMSAAAPVYSRAGMPVVMPVPTNPKITKQGHTNLFRVPPTDDDQAPFLARYVLAKDRKAPVAVVSDLTAYGVGFAEAFRDTFRGAGGNIVAFEGAQKDSRDFRTLITKLKGLTPKYVVLGATYDMGAPFVRQMRELGLDATVLSGDGCYGSAFTDQAGDAAEGAIVSFIAPDRGSSPATETFFKAYEAKFGKVVSFAPLGYDAAKVVIEAIKETTSPTRASIIKTLSGTGFKVDGVTGPVEFAENGDNKSKNLVLYVVKDGKFVLLK